MSPCVARSIPTLEIVVQGYRKNKAQCGLSERVCTPGADVQQSARPEGLEPPTF